MPRALVSRTIKVSESHSGYNSCKARVMVAVYCCRFWQGKSGLTLRELQAISQVTHAYLKQRLPVFCGSRRYLPTNKPWPRPLLVRRAVTQNKTPVFLYQLSRYGRSWVEDGLSRSKFFACADFLGLRA